MSFLFRNNSAKTAVLFCTAAVLLLTSCKEKTVGAQTQKHLGTVCTVNLYEQGTASVYKEIFARLEQIENEFSTNIPSSDISIINQHAGQDYVTACDDVIYVLTNALYYAETSGGAFDPTVGPLVKLWGINTESEKIPSQSQINEALALINYRDVQISGNSVKLNRSGMSLDLGGIAKGFAADEIVKILKQNQIKKAVIDLGGNIYAYGKKDKNSTPWNIAIKDPAEPEGSPALAAKFIVNTTVVTSGVYERYFVEDGKQYHHILSTETGYPAENGMLSTTIISDCSMEADALSTISFILGPEKFLSLNIRNFSGQKNKGAVFISKEKEVTASKNLSENISAFKPEYDCINFR